MVQKRWRVAKKGGDEAEDIEEPELLQWLCGQWEDHKGSSYDVSLSEKGAVLLNTTRPSGEVVHSNGLIRESAGRIVWGRPRQRKVYTLEKENNNTLRWRSSDQHGNVFDWNRQDPISTDDSAEGQRSVRGERRALSHRDYQKLRENVKTNTGLAVTGTEAKDDEKNEKEDETREDVAVASDKIVEDKPGEPRAQSRWESQIRRENAKSITKLVGSDLETKECEKKGDDKREDVAAVVERNIEDRLLEFLTSPPEAETPALAMQAGVHDFEQQWHEQQLYQNFYLQWGMWDNMQDHYNYFAQFPIPGLPPQVWQNPYVPAMAMQPVGKAR